MKTSRIERIEKVTVMLEQDIDFTKEDLVPNKIVNGKLLELSNKKLNDVAINHNYRRCSWSGHYDPETRTVKAQFERDLFI